VLGRDEDACGGASRPAHSQAKLRTASALESLRQMLKRKIVNGGDYRTGR
jgi:hypothetical protein